MFRARGYAKRTRRNTITQGESVVVKSEEPKIEEVIEPEVIEEDIVNVVESEITEETITDEIEDAPKKKGGRKKKSE